MRIVLPESQAALMAGPLILPLALSSTLLSTLPPDLTTPLTSSDRGQKTISLSKSVCLPSVQRAADFRTNLWKPRRITPRRLIRCRRSSAAVVRRLDTDKEIRLRFTDSAGVGTTDEVEEEEEGAREDERCRDGEEARLEAPSPREEEARLTDEEERIYTGKYKR